MKKIIINTHVDFIETDDPEFIAAYQKRATDILSAEWDVIEFENVIAQKSWRYEVDDCLDDNLGFWTQEALERAYQEAQG